MPLKDLKAREIYKKKYYRENREVILKKRREWYKKNKENLVPINHMVIRH